MIQETSIPLRTIAEVPLTAEQAKAVMGGGSSDVRIWRRSAIVDCHAAPRSDIHRIIDTAGGGRLSLDWGVDFGLVLMEEGQRVFVETDPKKVMQLHPALAVDPALSGEE